MDKQKLLDKVASEIKNCKVCRKNKSAKKDGFPLFVFLKLDRLIAQG